MQDNCFNINDNNLLSANKLPKEALEIDNKEFCLHFNSEKMDETIPVINKYLEILPNNLSDKQKLQQLTEWLKELN